MNIEQRISDLEQVLDQVIDEVWIPNFKKGWPFTQTCTEQLHYKYEEELPDWINKSSSQMRSWWPGNVLGKRALEMYFHPELWTDLTPCSPQHDKIAKILILEDILIRFPPENIFAEIKNHLKKLLMMPETLYKLPNQDQLSGEIRRHIFPRPENLFKLLYNLPATEDSLQLMSDVFLGKYDCEVPGEWSKSLTSSYQLYSHGFYFSLPWLALRLFQNDQFSYQLYHTLIYEHAPYAIRITTQKDFWSRYLTPYPQDYIDQFLCYREQLLEECAQNLTSQSSIIINEVYSDFVGAKWLLYAAQAYAKLSPRPPLIYKKFYSEDHSKPYAAIIKMAGAKKVDPASPEERTLLLKEYQTQPAEVLKMLLPHTVDGMVLLCDALGWQRALPLVMQLHTYANLCSHEGIRHYPDQVQANFSQRYPEYAIHIPPLREIFDALDCSGLAAASEVVERVWSTTRCFPWFYGDRDDVANSADLYSGKLDIQAVRQIVGTVGLETAREVLALYRKAKVIPNIVMLYEALYGWNTTDVHKKLKRRNQMAIKAYGLLPLERSEDAIQRYRFFKQFVRESRQFGPERQANERAAAQAGLLNLAQTAGYPDLTRLEWAMETYLSQEISTQGRSWALGEYEACIMVIDGQPELHFSKDGKQLKTKPRAINKDPVYTEIKEQVNELRQQSIRFRTTFEELMITQEPLSLQDLHSLSNLPIARDLLTHLILQEVESGFYGLLYPESFSLINAEGTAKPICGPVTILHPYHLHQEQQLYIWQMEIVRRKLVQPCKQVFRELYLLSPGERANGLFSTRFAGVRVDGARASRLFQSRGWLQANSDVPMPFKPFPQHGIEVSFTFQDVAHYLSSADDAISDEIFFTRYSGRTTSRATKASPGHAVPLEQIPPVLFSEAMRDADLIISIAQQEDGKDISPETYQRRGELILALAEDLLLEGVSIEGHFVRVKGKWGTYRIHLGSGVAHREPGEALVILQEKSSKSPNKNHLYLPFATENDLRASEIISKVLLLSHDDKIRDENLLKQLKGQDNTVDPHPR